MELLVALTLLGVLAAGVSGVLGNTEAGVVSGRRAIAENERLRALDRVLALAVRGAREIPLANEDRDAMLEAYAWEGGESALEQPRIRFLGDEAHFGLVVDRPVFAARPDGRLHWMEIFVRREHPDDSLGTLVVRDVPFLKGLEDPLGLDEESEYDPEAVARTHEVLRRVRSVRFTYVHTRRNWGFFKANFSPWEYSPVPAVQLMPAGVRMEVTLADGRIVEGAYDIGMKYETWREPKEMPLVD